MTGLVIVVTTNQVILVLQETRIITIIITILSAVLDNTGSIIAVTHVSALQ